MELGRRNAPSLVDLCIKSAIKYRAYLGDVGQTDASLLEEILPHCSIDELRHIEISTEGRDLSEVTDSLWKIFYEQHFGVESAKIVIRRMEQKKINFAWKLLYEAKLKEREEAEQKSIIRLKQLYAEEDNKKQSRQIKICSKVPPSSNKRSFSGGSGPCSNMKNNLMKKAKLEYLNSHEARLHAAMKKKELQRKSFPPQSIPRSTGTSGFCEKGPGSSSKLIHPVGRKK